jgi:ATP-dependent helicase/DNAse subunit B
MPLRLIHGPPNSGRAGLIRRGFSAALDREPVLVVPNRDDVFRFERELCEAGAALGGSVMTFEALAGAIATAGGAPPGLELTRAQRLRAVAVAISERHGQLGPLRHAATRPGFPLALERLLGELQEAGLDPEALGPRAETLEGSAYLTDLLTLLAAYAELRDRLGRTDSHDAVREAIVLLRRSPELWRERPLFLYGFDDLTRTQLDLVAALAAVAEVTVALTHEEGRPALAARAGLLPSLRAIDAAATETRTQADPEHTANRLLFHIERNFGALDPERRPPGEGLTILRSAGQRGEAEAIGVEVARLLAGGVDPAEIAVLVRDPAGRGPGIAATLEAYGIAVALEAELPVAQTAVGGTLIALLEAELGARRSSDLLRYLRGPSGAPPARVDWFERQVRRGRIQAAAAALAIWQGEDGELPRDLARLRAAAAGSAAELTAEAGRIAATMAARPLRGRGDGPRPAPGEGLELRAAAAIGAALAELAELESLAPRPEQLADVVRGIQFRAWSGPVEGRVRIADPYRLRAARFDHVFVASLQDGELPRRDRDGDPFLSEGQRTALGLDPRRDAEAEERYLFYTCLSLPRESLFLSYRDSDEDGAAEARSPLLDEVRALLDPPPDGQLPDPVEEAIVHGRDLARVVHPIAEAPSEDELARSLATHAAAAEATELLAGIGIGEGMRSRIEARIAAARAADATSRAPGPLTNPAAIESLAAVPAYGGTTLEEFDLCSYRWFVGHELDPQPLDPVPEPLVQGGLMHAALERLYRERPGGGPLPRPASLAVWTERGRELVAELAAERGLGRHPVERAMARRVERLLTRFLGEEAERDAEGFEPWLLEARFGAGEECERPVLEIDGWGLHGAIDRVDRDAHGRALVLDYKLASAVTPREKLEEKAKLQLQLYLLAVAEHWGAEPIGGLYHPLRATSQRRPRGLVFEEASDSLASYQLYKNDLVDRGELDEALDEARRRAGAIVARMRRGDIRRDPGPRPGLRGHDVCPTFCDFATICRRDRAPFDENGAASEER